MAAPKQTNTSDTPDQQPDLGADFLQGYESATCESADSPDYPGNQVWGGPGSSAIAYKTHWKTKPPIFPYGTNDEGGK